MTSGSKQHFIPQFYMKRFALSESDGHYRLFRIATGAFNRRASIRGHAWETDFYGTEGLDDVLKPIESNAARIIERAHVDNVLPKKGTSEFDYLVYFVASLKGRTKKAAEELSAFMGAGIKNIMLQDSRLRESMKDGSVRLTDSQVGSTVAALQSAVHARNLGCKILRNPSAHPFVSSDSPVVSYNQFAEYRKIDFGATGFGWKGLQMFLPIGPNAMLMFYDDKMYKVGNRKDIEVGVSVADVFVLNRLQIANAEDLIYGSDGLDESYVREQLQSVQSLRDRQRFEISTHETDDPLSMLQVQKGKDIRINLSLSFAKMTDRARSEPLQDFDMQLRDESIRYRRRR